MKVLVTGGGGFIGSHLVRALVDRGMSVRVTHGTERSLEKSLLNAPEAEHLVVDITDIDRIRDAVAGVETIYHLAGFGAPGSPHSDDMEIIRVNISGTCTLLQEATAANVQRFVFASSASVYGDSPNTPKVESLPTLPKSVYAASKMAAEGLCHVFRSQRGLDTYVLRFFNVYGVGQEPMMVVPRITEQLTRGETVTLYGDGQQTRDFIHVTDVVAATILAGETKGADARLFNIGSGTPTPIRTIVETIARILHVEPKLICLPERPGEIRESVADISAARSGLGFVPSIDVAYGLELTCSRTRATSGGGRP